MAYDDTRVPTRKGRMNDARDEMSEMDADQRTRDVESKPDVYRKYQRSRRFNMLLGRPDPKRPY